MADKFQDETQQETRPEEQWIGHVEILDISAVPDGEGDGFIRTIPGSEDFAETVFRIEPIIVAGSPGPANRKYQDRDLHPVEDIIPASPGSYRLTFRAEGGHCAPPPLEVTVRPGLGVIAIVRYYRPSDLYRWEEEAQATLAFIKSLTCSAAPKSGPAANPGTESGG